MKTFFKKILGKFYYNFRLKIILNFIFGKYFWILRNLFKNILKPFKFNLSKQVERQKIITKELGLVIDFTINNYLTIHLRPKKSINFNLISTDKINKKIGIVIQGQIGKSKKFLIETLQIYNKIFKNSKIYISTWENEDFEINDIDSYQKIKILKNKEPTKSIYNINHQIISTFRGIEEAEKDGCDFILKTRPDVRIYKNNTESFLISLINTFPSKKTINRIIVPNLTTFKYRLYGITDITLFGELQNMKKYFDSSSYENSLKNYKLLEKNNFINKTPVVAEIFLCSRYLMNQGEELKWNLQDYWQHIRDYFCIIDSSSIDLIWNKYDHDYEFRFWRTYNDKTQRGIDFADWLSLYQGSNLNWENIFSEHEKYNERMRLTNLF